jgi:hypothetical protein
MAAHGFQTPPLGVEVRPKRNQAASTTPAISRQPSAVSTVPKAGAETRMKMKEAPQIATRKTKAGIVGGVHRAHHRRLTPALAVSGPDTGPVVMSENG